MYCKKRVRSGDDWWIWVIRKLNWNKISSLRQKAVFKSPNIFNVILRSFSLASVQRTKMAGVMFVHWSRRPSTCILLWFTTGRNFLTTRRGGIGAISGRRQKCLTHLWHYWTSEWPCDSKKRTPERGAKERFRSNHFLRCEEEEERLENRDCYDKERGTIWVKGYRELFDLLFLCDSNGTGKSHCWIPMHTEFCPILLH